MLVLTCECSLDLRNHGHCYWANINLWKDFQIFEGIQNFEESRVEAHLLISCMAFMSSPSLPLVSKQMLSTE
jgi:hypothetical protein